MCTILHWYGFLGLLGLMDCHVLLGSLLFFKLIKWFNDLVSQYIAAHHHTTVIIIVAMLLFKLSLIFLDYVTKSIGILLLFGRHWMTFTGGWWLLSIVYVIHQLSDFLFAITSIDWSGPALETLNQLLLLLTPWYALALVLSQHFELVGEEVRHHEEGNIHWNIR